MAIYAENVRRTITNVPSTVSVDPPADPTEGQMWVERDTGNIYIFKDGQWMTPSLADINGGSA